MAKSSTRRVNIYINGREVEGTVKQIRAEMNKLVNEQNRMVMGSDEYIAHAKKIKELRGYLNEHAQNIGTAASAWSEMYNKVMQFGAGLGGFTQLLSTFDSVAGTLKQVATDLAAMDDVYSDVIKTTNLTREQVEALNESFKNMDTRTSREQLNNLAYIAGKLGISSEELVKQFVEAADIINVSMGDVLGDDATLAVGKMVDVYKKSTDILADKNLKEQLLSLGSAVNELGKVSTANEQYMVNFTGRLGGIAVQAGLSADEILGYASALDQDMQKVEMSATAFQKLIQKVISKPADFARIAGMQLKEFNDLVANDMNAALKKVLKGFSGAGGFDKLLPVFQDLGLDSARAAAAISSMANSLDKVESAQSTANQAMKEGVSCFNEFDVKNNNMQANLEKARKRFQDTRLELGEKLYPILLKLTKTTTAGIKSLSSLISWIDKNRSAFLALIAPITLYLGRIVYLKTSMIAVNALEKSAITLKATHKAVVYALAAAKATLAGNTGRAAAAMRAMKLASASVPWLAIATAIASLGVAVYNYATKTTLAEDAIKEFREESAKQRGECEELFNSLKHLKKGTVEYNTAQKKIIDTYPDILKNQIDEKGNLYEVRDAYNAVTAAIENNIAKRIKSEKSGSIYSTKIMSIGSQLSNSQFPEYEWQHIKDLADQGKSAQEILQSLNKNFAHSYPETELTASYSSYAPVSTNTESQYLTSLKNIVKIAREANAELKKIDKQFAPFIQPEPETPQTNGEKENESEERCNGDWKTCQCSSCETKRNQINATAEANKTQQQEWEKFLDTVQQLREENRLATMSDIQKEKAQIETKYNEQITIAQKFAKIKGKMAVEAERELTTLRNQSIERADKASREKQIKEIEASYQKLCDKVQYLQEKLSVSSTNKYADELKKVQNQWTTILKEIDKNIAYYQNKEQENYDPVKGTGLSADEITLLNKLLEQKKQAIISETQEEMDVVQRAEKEISDSLMSEREKRIAEVKKEYAEKISIAQTAIAKLKTLDEQENQDRIQQLENQIEQLKMMMAKELEDIDFNEKRKGTTGVGKLLEIDWKHFKKDWEKNLADIADVIEEFANEATRLFDSIDQIQKNREEKLLNQYRKNYDERKDKLDWQLKEGIISQEYYNAQVEKLDEDLDKKQKELELEQFRREQKAAIAQAVISGILSAVKSFESGGGFPWGLIPMALSIAVTAAQVAAIQSQPEPYASGGYIEQEKHILAGERGREWIASNTLLSNPETAPAIAALEDYQRGNKSAWQEMQVAIPDSQNLSQAANTISGNFVTNNSQQPIINNYNTTQTQESQIFNQMLEEMTELRKYMSDPKNRQAVISRDKQLEFEQQEKFLRSAAALK